MTLSKKALEVKESSTLNITAKAKAMKAQGVDVIGFGAGEPDFPTPEHICQAAVEAIQDGFTKYTPSSGIVELRRAICTKLEEDNGLNYDYSQIIVSNGAKHALTNVFTAIINQGDEVIILAPFWLSYSEMVHIAGGVPKIVHTEKKDDFCVTKEQLEKAYSKKTKAIIINSPSNPTGMVYSREVLEMIADFAVKNDIFVISDEIYEKLVYDKESVHVSIASFNDEIFKRTIVINGFSKTYSMTGWRIGYSASSKEIADVIGNLQSHSTSNANSVTQKAALAALTGDQKCITVMREEFGKRRDYIYGRVQEIPLLDALKPQGAFYLFVDISNLCGKEINGKIINDAADVADVLISEYKVAVVPCADFGFDKYLRFSYAISQENIEKGMNRVEEFVRKYYV